MDTRQKVIVTGASGFVGANLCHRLVRLGYNVHLLLRKESQNWRLRYIRDHVTIHETDLSDLVQLKETCSEIQPNYIFHLAVYGAYSKQADLFSMIQTNIVGTTNLLEATKDIPYSLFVNTGSSSEYGFKNDPMKEIDYLQPNSYYSATKGSATLLSQAFAHLHNKPIITFRLFSVYGPFEEPGRFVPTAIIKALLKKPLSMVPGKSVRDFIYVDDVIDAYVKAMNAKILNGDIFNICSGKQSTLDDIAEIIKDKTDGLLEIQKGAYQGRAWDADKWVGDNNKAVKTLNWMPQHSIEQGLEKSVAWFKGSIR